jgi:hypothetical protein
MKALPVLLVGSLSLLVLTAFGCGSSNSDSSQADSGADGASTGADSGRDGGTSGDGSTRRDGGDAAIAEGGDAGTCAMPLTNFTPATYVSATVAKGSCSPTEITNFLTDCVDNSDPATCNTWLDTNLQSDAGAGTTCGNCIFNATNSGAGWVDPNLYTSEHVLIFNPNYAACIELTDTTYGAACGGAFNNLRSCEDVACNSCVDNPSFVACQAVVDQGDCKTYSDTTVSDCVHDIADGGAYSTCMPSTASHKLDDDWKLIIGMVCGS